MAQNQADHHVFEEVDEELAADRMQRYWQENKHVIIAGFILFFAALFTFVGYRDYRASQDAEASDLFLAGRDALRQGNLDQTKTELDALLTSFGDHGYGQLGRLLKAQVAIREKAPDQALILLDDVIKNAQANDALRSIALLNAAYLLSEEPVKARTYLDQLAEEGPFGAQALELRGLFAQREGDEQAALGFYRKSLAQNNAASLSGRLQRRIARIAGPEEPVAVDEDVAMPTADEEASAPATESAAESDAAPSADAAESDAAPSADAAQAEDQAAPASDAKAVAADKSVGEAATEKQADAPKSPAVEGTSQVDAPQAVESASGEVKPVAPESATTPTTTAVDKP